MLVSGFVKVEVESDWEDPGLIDCCVVETAKLLRGCSEVSSLEDWVEEPNNAEELEPNIGLELVIDADVNDGVSSKVEDEEPELLLSESVKVSDEVSNAIEEEVLLAEPKLEDAVIEELLFEAAMKELVSVGVIALDEDATTDVVELAETEAAPDAVRRLDKALAEVAVEAVLLDDEELDPMEVVVRLARRLEAEADDELGAVGETPMLSALMISAACRHVRAVPIKKSSSVSPFLQHRRQRPVDEQRGSWGRFLHRLLGDSESHAPVDGDRQHLLVRVATLHKYHLDGTPFGCLR